MFRTGNLILFLVFFSVIQAQEVETHFYSKIEKNERYDAGSLIFTGIVLPSYTPEMGFNITGGCLLNFKSRRNNPYLTHSILPLMINLSPDGDFSGYLELNSYWFDDRLKFDLSASFINRDDHYWGIGAGNAESVTMGASTTAYHIKSSRITPLIYIRTTQHIDLGFKLDIRTTEVSDLSDFHRELPEIIDHKTSIVVSGAGISVRYDTRNSRTKPEKGVLIVTEGIFYKENLGKKNNYGLVSLDYRQYLPIIRVGSLLSWSVKANQGIGEIPWPYLPQLGSTPDQRGYFAGQYRDHSMVFGQLEYRHTVLKRENAEPSRHGFVFWIGAGTVFEKIDSIDTGILNTGIGYRFEMLPGINLRLDAGFSAKYAGIYIGFCEAF